MSNSDIEKFIFNNLERMGAKNLKKDSIILNVGIDSLDLVEMVTDLEEHFSIEISDDELMSIKTINDVIEMVTKKITK
ncbi:phosphopantetheine-binding protein [Mycoplasma iguanae]|uniref:Phosphopantetheine-binding protein n=1 Tax=Mycoplasma iguanae TaxID=292461 RepID=A0ABY5R8S0_9MOLU|nr:phosphopantetheine-binding protein [Mycoplasma iguanae]UVD81838.1 phosphopantetheine-binding protein [Mycoplasma iguanae]